MAVRYGQYDEQKSINNLLALLSRARTSVGQRMTPSSDGSGVEAPNDRNSPDLCGPMDGALGLATGAATFAVPVHGGPVSWEGVCQVTPMFSSFSLEEPEDTPRAEPMPATAHFELPAGIESSESPEPDDWEVQTDDGFDDRWRGNNNTPTTSVTPSRRGLLRPLAPGVTTLVVRNIPARYTKEKLLEEWVPDGSFNLLHLPFNVHQQRSCGYAFINFVTAEAALEFQAKVHGLYPQLGSGKHLDVSAAEVQGLDATLQMVISSRKRQRTCFVELIPAIFRGQEQLDPEQVMAMMGLEQMKLVSIRARVPRGGAKGRGKGGSP